MSKPAATQKQRLAFRYALKNPYSIIAMDPRLGKSRVAIGIQRHFKCNCVIVAPGYLVPNWPKEIRKWAGPEASITVIEKGKDIYEICDTDFAIISYDLAQKAENFFEWADLVVIDEGHNLKAMDAKRTQYIHRVIYENSVPRVLILTGTPLKNRVKEFYSLIAITYYNPSETSTEFLDRFPTEIDFADHFAYRKQFNVPVVTKNGRKFDMPVAKWEGLRNLPELKKYLAGRYIRIRADESDLPPVSYRPILVNSTADKELLRAFEAFFADDGAGSVKPEQKREAAVKKAPFTIKYVENLLEQVDCALVYSDHVPSAEAIAAHFGVKAVTGKMPAKIRSRIADQFQAGEGRILVATVGAMKEGKDLWRSRDVVFNDYPWVPGDLKQAINRIRSMGSKNPVTVHKIMGSPQDEYIMETLEEKIQIIERAT